MRGLSVLLSENLFAIVPILLILTFTSLIWVVVLQLQLKKIKEKNEILFSGKKAIDLENVILEQGKNLKILDKDIQELYEISNQINSLAFKSLHKVGMVRYNPFKDVGGDQSFAIAILNGKNSGITLSSLFTREGTRIYSKTIVAGASQKHPLTEEEKEAIRLATELEPQKA